MKKGSENINIKQASIYYLFGSLFSKGIAFLTVPIFTRILSTTDYGIINTYSSWVSIVSVVLGFALHMGVRASFLDYKDEVDDFLSVTVTFVVAIGMLFSGMVLLTCWLMQVSVSLLLILLCLLQSVSTAIIEDYSMYLMMQYRYKARTAIMVLPNLLSSVASIAVILFVVKSDAYMGRIIPMCAIYVAFCLMIVLLIYRRSKVFYKRSYITFGLKISAPLIFHGIALSVLSQSDRMMITEFAGADQTGVYSLVYNFSMIATVITTSLDGVWVPWFYDRYAEHDYETINETAKKYVQLITVAMIGLIAVGPEIIKLLAPQEYWEGITIIPPVVLSAYVIFLYTLYVNVEHYHKKTVRITGNTIVAAATNIVLNFILVPKFGYVAAAYTTLISYCVSLLIHVISTKMLDWEVYPLKIFAVSLLQNLIAVVAFYIFQDMWIARWGAALVYTILLAVVYIKDIMKFSPSINKFMRKSKKG